jgi:hypothetical protein
LDREQYFVVLHDGECKVKHGVQHSHPYASQREAIASAMEAAPQASERGQLSQVLVQGEKSLDLLQ